MARLILHALRIGAVTCAVLTAGGAMILLGQTALADPSRGLAARDYAFLGLLAFLLLGCLWLAVAVSRELRK